MVREQQGVERTCCLLLVIHLPHSFIPNLVLIMLIAALTKLIPFALTANALFFEPVRLYASIELELTVSVHYYT